MNVTYSEKTRQSEDYPLLQQATNLLEEFLGPTAASVSAAWDRSQNAAKQPVYVLTISDRGGEASATFTPTELRLADALRFGLRLLVANLGLIHLDKQVQKLQEMVAQGD